MRPKAKGQRPKVKDARYTRLYRRIAVGTIQHGAVLSEHGSPSHPGQDSFDRGIRCPRAGRTGGTLDLCATGRGRAAGRCGAARSGSGTGRAADDPHGQHQRLRPAVLRRYRRRLRAAAVLGATDRGGGGFSVGGFRRPNSRHVRRTGDCPAAGCAGAWPFRHCGAADPMRTAGLRRYRRRRSGLSHLHLRHHRPAQGRVARPAVGLGAATDVPRLV